MKYTSLLLFLPIWCSLLGQNYNMEHLSNVRFPDECANIWGYADSSKKEYAVIGRIFSTSVFDVTDGKNPKLIKNIPGAPSQWREIKSWKNRIYVVADRGADGVLIINMEKAPGEVSFAFWKPMVSVDDKILNIKKTGTIDRAHDLFIDEKGYCYLTGSNFHQGTVILDVNKNPDNPEFVGIFNPNYTHDAFARNDTFWSADIIAGEFTVWDLKDKLNPKKLANQKTGNAFTHNIWLSDDGKYAFTTDERANAYVESYKVDDLKNITLLDRYRSRTTKIRNTIPHNTFYHKNMLFTSYYTDGFTVVDASRPDHLVEVASFDTYPAGDGDFHGCWGVYPYLPSGNILASDIEFGLYVVKPNLVQAAFLTGIITDSITSLPINNALVRIEKESNLEIASSPDGKYKTGGPYTGITSFKVSAAGYIPKKIVVNLQSGQVVTQHIKLVPYSKTNILVKVIDAHTKKPVKDATVQFFRDLEVVTILSTEDSLSATINNGGWTILAGKWGYNYKTSTVLLNKTENEISITLDRGYQDDFIFNYGWTAQSTAGSGIWGRAEPLGAYIREITINPELDLSDDNGTLCMITGNGSTVATGNDVDRGYTRLFSPEIDLTNFNKIQLQFYAWTVRRNTVDSIIAIGTHKVYVVSEKDTLLIDSLPANLPAWTKYTYVLDTGKIKNKALIKIMFEAFEPSTADARNIVEFGVDGFSLKDLSTTSNKDDQKRYPLVSVFPNPGTGQFVFTSDPSDEDRLLTISTLNGRLVYSQNFPKNWNQIHSNIRLIPGIYVYHLSSSKDRVYSGKLILVE